MPIKSLLSELISVFHYYSSRQMCYITVDTEHYRKKKNTVDSLFDDITLSFKISTREIKREHTDF